MALKANYFKLGLFVIGAIVAGVIVLVIIGSGRWFRPKVTIESYFNESVQGLDIGSRLKYRGVTIGQVTRIGFTYTKYQQDRPTNQRARYVLVEAQIEPRQLGGRAAAGDITDPVSAQMEIDRGLRMRLAPQGIPGTSYLEIDYVEPIPTILPIDWTPDNIYIPSAPSTFTTVVNSAIDILDKLQKVDIEKIMGNLNRLLVTTNARVDTLDTKAISQSATSALAKIEKTFDQIAAKKLSDEGVALLTELRASNAELKKTLANPALQKLPDDTAAAIARVRAIVDDPNLPKAIANLSRSLGRLDRILGGGEADLTVTIENLRQITDNLRDLTEDIKRYPGNVIFGEPPKPTERPK